MNGAIGLYYRMSENGPTILREVLDAQGETGKADDGDGDGQSIIAATSNRMRRKRIGSGTLKAWDTIWSTLF